jgi:hypothetical protein
MSRSLLPLLAIPHAVLLPIAFARAQQPEAMTMTMPGHEPPPAEGSARDDDEAAQLPYGVPRQTLIPGTPGMPGGYHLMVNSFAQLQDVGLGGYRISNANVHSWNAGATYPLLTDDWVMGYGRDAGGWIEGLLMLDFEPFTNTSAGIPELGQSGEGLWDAQHAHQLVHQAMVAVHPLAGLDGWHPESRMQEGRYDLSIFGGQGSATIGPPIFMHRASSPGPTVPRKHHKGENPHETFPVLGAALRIDDTWVEASAFSALELTPQDSRFYPHVAPPASFAYGWADVRGWRLDGLLDWALDAPDADANGDRHTAQGALAEFAARTPNRRQTVWMRSEFNQREEAAAFGGGVSSPWFFETAGFEHVVLGGRCSGLQLGLFAEATYVNIPPALRGFYGSDSAVTINAGLHVFGMWMLDGNLRPMEHRAR